MSKWRRIRRRIALGLIFTLVVILVVMAAGVLAISWAAADQTIHPSRERIVTDPRTKFKLPYEEVYFTASDGIRLSGWWIPAERPRGTLLLLHGSPHSRQEVLPQAPYLHDAGYDLLLFDWRAHGQSEGAFTSLGHYEQRDLAAALDYASGRGHGQVGALAMSVGAATAILEGAHNQRLRALVADSTLATIEGAVDTAFPILTRNRFPGFRDGLPAFPFARLAVLIAERRTGLQVAQLRALDRVADFSPRPLLLIYGSADIFVPPSETLHLFERAREPKEILAVEGAGHPSSGQDAFQTDPATYQQRVLAFFNQSLRP